MDASLPAYLFHQGTNYTSYDYLGSHSDPDGKTIRFRVWAPNADHVFLCGDFNDWDLSDTPLTRITDGGIWEAALSSEKFLSAKNQQPADRYKYRICHGSSAHLKSDPYAFYSETLKNTASRLYNIDSYEWRDRGWMSYRKRMMSVSGRPDKSYRCPINIYEMHLGSWRTRDGKTTKDGSAYLTYSEIADELIPYVKRMGYTHVELMPVMEHPFDGSWGYQVCGYYAPTSRFGTPSDFMSFIDRLHCAGIGVILDWVPAHFPKDEHGLYEFDGGPLYEYQGRDRMEHSGWGTRCFDVGRNEVQCFLVSNAMFWLTKYHADGLRIDAVASMLYLDYDRSPGEWIPNKDGSNKNLEAVAFFKKLNGTVAHFFPDVMMIAEESTSWGGLTQPTERDGLGFTLKWNMGWANDMFDYVGCDPLFRKYCHDKLTFSLTYAFSERFVLPISHDEVVHGKKSLLDKMFGDYAMKFEGYRAFMCHMIGHPGKKMTFMGCEYGPFREWDYENQLEWFMLDYEPHKKLQYFVADLNRFYLEHPALWEDDFSWNGFEWLTVDAKDDNVIAYRRKSGNGDYLICAINFSGVERRGYEIPAIPGATSGDASDDGAAFDCLETVFSSDSVDYGGGGSNVDLRYPIKDGLAKINLPRLSAVFLEYGFSHGINLP